MSWPNRQIEDAECCRKVRARSLPVPASRQQGRFTKGGIATKAPASRRLQIVQQVVVGEFPPSLVVGKQFPTPFADAAASREKVAREGVVLAWCVWASTSGTGGRRESAVSSLRQSESIRIAQHCMCCRLRETSTIGNGRGGVGGCQDDGQGKGWVRGGTGEVEWRCCARSEWLRRGWLRVLARAGAGAGQSLQIKAGQAAPLA